MTDNSSHRIVAFIAGLLPLYISEDVDGVRCARSLHDGTLILPVDVADTPEGLVELHWQGDPNRRTLVQGVFIASVAVARYIELHHSATHSKEMEAEMQSMSDHFTMKTGEALAFDSPGSGLLDLLERAIGKLGAEAVMDLLKKAAGL